MTLANTPSRRFSKRRDDILSNALRVFAERGLESTGIKEIADSLGLTHPALYHYFQSKEQLVFEAVEKAFSDEITAMEAAIEHLPDHPALRLHSLTRTQVTYELDDRAYVPLINAFLYGPLRNAAKLSKDQRRAIIALQKRMLALYRDVISQGQEAGDFIAGSATVHAFGVLGIASYAVFWFRADGEMSAAQVADLTAGQAVRSISNLVRASE